MLPRHNSIFVKFSDCDQNLLQGYEEGCEEAFARMSPLSPIILDNLWSVAQSLRLWPHVITSPLGTSSLFPHRPFTPAYVWRENNFQPADVLMTKQHILKKGNATLRPSDLWTPNCTQSASTPESCNAWLALPTSHYKTIQLRSLINTFSSRPA